MIEEQESVTAAYLFSADADPAMIRRFEGQELPKGVRFVASVSGPWQVFAAAELEDPTTDLPRIVNELFGAGQGTAAADPSTALNIGPSYVRRGTDYFENIALIRIHVSGRDPSDVLDEVRSFIGSEEANLVLGDFDILTCVSTPRYDDLVKTILSLRTVEGIGRTTSLRVIDYMSLGKDAPERHR